MLRSVANSRPVTRALPSIARAIRQPPAVSGLLSHCRFYQQKQPLRQQQQQQHPQAAFPPPPIGTGAYTSASASEQYARSKKIRFRLFYTTLAVLLMAYAGWKYITFHRYPPSVAAKLRKALFAESQENYTEALEFYIEALEEADRLRGVAVEDTGKPVDPSSELHYLSDEYTGIQLKIAYMYENLGLNYDALQIYRELGTSYIHALQTNIVPHNRRLDVMRRDLLVTIQAACLEAPIKGAAFTRFPLLVHFTMAQKELAEAHPELASLFEEESLRFNPSSMARAPLPSPLSSSQSSTIPTALPTLKSPQQDTRPLVISPNVELSADPPPSSTTSTNGKNKNVNMLSVSITLDASDTESAIRAREEAARLWEPYRDELFTCRQLFSTLCMASGNIGLAIQTTFNTTKWMVTAGFPIDEVLVSFYTAGSYLYLQAEEIEARNWTADQEKKKALKKIELEEDADLKATLKNDLNSPFFPPPPPNSIARQSLDNAQSIFEGVLATIKQLPSKMRREGSIDEVQALATYSLGVVQLHNGDLDKAQDLIREARLRAKGCGYDSLVDHADMELATVKDLKLAKESGDENYLSGLYNRPLPGPFIDVKMVPTPQNSPLSLSALSKS